jgi:transcriptional regulator with XRE-family HTH domain
VSYQDELDKIEEQIREELRRQQSSDEKQSPAFETPEELLSILRTFSAEDARYSTLSAFLRRLRTNAGARIEDVAAVLQLPIASLEQLESNDSAPWMVPPAEMAQVTSTLRIHLKILRILTQNSHTIASFSDHASDPEVTAQAMLTWLTEVEATLQTSGARDLLA